MSENHAPNDRGADAAPGGESSNSNAPPGEERADRMEKLLELQARLKRLTDEANQGQEERKSRRRPRKRSRVPESAKAEASTPPAVAAQTDEPPGEAVAVEDPPIQDPPAQDAGVKPPPAAKKASDDARAAADSFAAALRSSVRESRTRGEAKPARDESAAPIEPSPRFTRRASVRKRRAADRAESAPAAPDRATLGDRISGAIRAAANPLRTRINGRAKSGDPVKAEELTRSQGVGLKLLGAVLSGLALAVVAVVLLVQTGTVADPRSEQGDLIPSTASGSGFVPSLLSEEPGGETSTEPPPETTDAAEETSTTTSNIPPAGAGEGEGSSGSEGVATASVGFVGPPVEEPPQEVPEFVLDFARLQGDLAFRLGEYEMVQGEFDRGQADCDALAIGFERVDRAHLLLARLVARWPEKPRRQAAAYEELSSLTDTVNRQFGDSGCAAP